MRFRLDDVLPDEFSPVSCLEREECLDALLHDSRPGCISCRLDELAEEG